MYIIKNLNLIKIFFICVSFLIIIEISFSHPILPYDVVVFLENNSNATQKEIEEFMIKTYGTPILENVLYFEDDSFNDESYSKNFENFELFLSVKNENKSFFKNSKEFIILGIEHIIFGFDHVLFVLSLILVISSYRELFLMISTFTIAHSLTFILAGTNILTLSSKIVEPVIAFSIAYVAITSVFLKGISFFQKSYNKILTIFIFGLFHGLGFAGVFLVLQIPYNQYISSLLFFNLGVEIGQILILVLILPFLILSRRKNEKQYNIFITVLALIISLLAMFWIIQRVFF